VQYSEVACNLVLVWHRIVTLVTAYSESGAS